MATESKDYPLRFDVDYPDKLDRLTTFFRAFTVIPILIIFSLLWSGYSNGDGSGGSCNMNTTGWESPFCRWC